MMGIPIYYKHGAFAVVLIFAATSLLSACMQIRQFTYPDEFIWLDKNDVKGSMHAMGYRLEKLALLMEKDSLDLQDNQRQLNHRDILSELTHLEKLAISLGSGGNNLAAGYDQQLPATNHLLIDEHIDEFIDEVMQARLLAENNPPNYYGIGQLVGNCNACHRNR